MKLASIDVGLKRIGCAVSMIDSIVTPLPPILRKNRNQAAKEVDDFLNEWEIQKLIVGLPAECEGTARGIKHFVNLLNFKGEIKFIDESFSSYEAKEEIKGIIKQKRDGRIDSLSAKIILERYLSTSKA
jgi:putative Holliday junction resolvase